MNLILKKLPALLTIAIVFTLNTASALAKVGLSDTSIGHGDGIPSHVPKIGGADEIGINTTTAEQSVGIIMEKFTNILFMFAGAVAIYFILIAGLKLITARGEEEKVTKAHQMLFWSILGFLLVILSYALVVNVTAFVYRSLGR